MQRIDFYQWSLLSVLWASAFLAVDIAVDTVSPLLQVALRMGIGLMFLLIVLYASGGNLRLGARNWIIALIAGLSGNILPYWLIGWAEQSVESGLAALIMGISPIVTICLAPLVDRNDRITPSRLIGGLVGFGGILMLVGPNVLGGLGGDAVPQLALVLAALSYAFTALFSRKFAFGNPLQFAVGSVFAGTAFTFILAAPQMTVETLSAISLPSFLALIYLGLGSTGVAALLYFRLVPRIGAARVQQVNYVVPVLGAVLGVTFLAERLPLRAWAAIPVILFAVWLVNRRPR